MWEGGSISSALNGITLVLCSESELDHCKFFCALLLTNSNGCGPGNKFWYICCLTNVTFGALSLASQRSCFLGIPAAGPFYGHSLSAPVCEIIFFCNRLWFHWSWIFTPDLCRKVPVGSPSSNLASWLPSDLKQVPPPPWSKSLPSPWSEKSWTRWQSLRRP